MKISYKQITYLAIVFFFSVALNPEWSANPILWWMSFFTVLAVIIVTNNFKINFAINSFKIWGISFWGICFISIVYAMNRSVSFNCIKTLTILFIILFLVDAEIDSQDELETYMKLFLLSLFTMMIYVLFKIDLKSFLLTQHGEATTGLWNGNDVGMKCALFIIIALYFWDNNKKIIQRMVMVISMSIAFILVYFTASRKAFLMVVIGISLFYYLKHPTKKIRNLIVIFIGIYIVYMLLMNNTTLYNTIGWRIEGALALFNKSGKVDSSALLREKFDIVLNKLDAEFEGTDYLKWHKPMGGYFISVFTQNGCAKETVRLAKECGLILTNAGATYPHGMDPNDSNIRVAPSYPTCEDLIQAMDIFCVCVKLAAVNNKLKNN